MFFPKPARKRHARLLRLSHVDTNNISNDRHVAFLERYPLTRSC